MSGATQDTYHSAIVRYSLPDDARRCIVVSVWPIPANSGAVARATSAAAWMSEQPRIFQDANIPFLSDQDARNVLRTATGFGELITLPHYHDCRPSWILTFDLPFTKAVRVTTFSSIYFMNIYQSAAFQPDVRLTVADMIRIDSYSTALSSLDPSVAQVSLTLLSQPSTIEMSLCGRLFGSAPLIRLGSQEDRSDDDYVGDDGFGFLRLMAPRSKMLSDVLEQHKAAVQRNDIVRRWLGESSWDMLCG